jgi:large subunit ribosomal protein L25
MAEQVSVPLQPRTTLGKQVRRLRREGMVPANIYGHNRASRAVQLDAKEAQRLLVEHGSSVLRLRLDGVEEAAIIRGVKRQPKSGKIEHIDFMHIELDQPMRARVPIHPRGEAPAVRVHGGTLLQLVDSVEVECLPANLPPAVELDIAQLEALDSTLHAADVILPRNVRLLTRPDEVVVKVEPPRVEEVAAPTAIEETPAAAAASEAEPAEE